MLRIGPEFAELPAAAALCTGSRTQFETKLAFSHTVDLRDDERFAEIIA